MRSDELALDEPGARHRRRTPKRWAAPAAAALAIMAVAAALAVAAGMHGHRGVRRDGPPAFAGGGRILLYVPGYGLEWVYPDGRVRQIARGFFGSRLVLGGTRLLAWRPTRNPLARPPCGGCFADVDYYLMDLNGARRRPVLAAEDTAPAVRVGHNSVELSPDGSKLAYLRLGISTADGSEVFSQLWVADLATGKRADLGPAGNATAWISDSRLLTQPADGTALQEVDVRTGHRTTFLSVADPRVVRAYERARPGSGPPLTIDLAGVSTDPGDPFVAVTLRGVTQRSPTKAVVALVGHGKILGHAPDKYPLVSLTWGPGGRFVLESTPSVNSIPPNLYAGRAGSEALYRLPDYGNASQFAFSPDRTMVAEGYENGTVHLVPTPAPLCGGSARCGARHGLVLGVSGILYGWAPSLPG